MLMAPDFFFKFLGVEIGLGFLATELFQKVGFVLLVNPFV
jgi:hypothetical protein